MVTPNRLRYIQCELPDDFINSLVAFEDDFDAQIKPYFERLEFLKETELPGIKAAIEEQVEFRKQLLEGSPVPNFGSMEKIEEFLKLTSPARDPTTPESRRIDEQKLGAYGILCLKGKLFKIVKGRRVEAYRRLWQLGGNSFQNFVDLAESHLASTPGDVLFLQNNNAKKNESPYVDRSFDQIYAISGYQPSLFSSGIFWNETILASTANRRKLDNYGFTSAQITNIFASRSPNADVDLKAKFRTVLSYLSTLSKLLILPKNDPLRNPKWQSESDWIEKTLKEYFEYRLLRNMSSSLLDPSFYSLLMQNLQPDELKELFEYRPDVLDFDLPQKIDDITELCSTAMSVPSESAVVNTYMLQIPEQDKFLKDFECRLFDIGLTLWKIFIKEIPERATTLEVLLQELTGKKDPLTDLTPRCMTDAQLTNDEILKALGAAANTQASGAAGDLINVITTGDDPTDKELVTTAIGASASGNTAATQNEEYENRSEAKSAGEQPGSKGKKQGRPSVETAAMLLARLTNWSKNFGGCGSIDSSSKEGIAGSTDVIDSRTGQKLASTTNSADEIVNKDLGTQTVKKINQTYTSELIRAPQVVMNASAAAVVLDGTDSTQSGAMSEPVYRVKISNTNHGIREGSSINIYEAPNSKLLGKFYPKVVDSKTLEFETTGTPAPGEGVISYEYLPRVDSSNYSASKRRDVVSRQGTPAQLNVNLELTLNKCDSGPLSALSKWLESKRKLLEKWLERIIDVIREVLITVMDKIDAFILQLQLAIDGILAILERLLTLDINLSGGGGYENSLIKCVFAVDLTLKIDLLSLLLPYLQGLFATIGTPIRKFLDLIRDFILNIFCIPIKWLNDLLNPLDDQLEALSDLTFGVVSCSVKDVKLPAPMLELLQLLNGLFSLRGLVIRQSNSDWLSMSLNLRKSRDNFTGLSQFASICSRPTMAQLQAKMVALAEETLFALPTKKSAIQYQSGKRAAAAAFGANIA